MAKDIADTDGEPGATGTFTQVCLGLVWLGATMYIAHAAITGSGQDVFEPFGAALVALPGLVAAMLVTAASIGAAAGSRLRRAGARLVAGLAVGTLFGLAVAAGIRFVYGGGESILTLAITVGAAGIVGGVLAVLPGQVLVAGLWGTTWVFLAGVMLGVLQPYLVRLLGGGEAAATRLVLGKSLVIGLAAALCAVRFLRVKRNRVLWYLVVGAFPGLVLLCAEWLTRAGGSAVAELVELPPFSRRRDHLVSEGGMGILV